MTSNNTSEAAVSQLASVSKTGVVGLNLSSKFGIGAEWQGFAKTLQGIQQAAANFEKVLTSEDITPETIAEAVCVLGYHVGMDSTRALVFDGCHEEIGTVMAALVRGYNAGSRSAEKLYSLDIVGSSAGSGVRSVLERADGSGSDTGSSCIMDFLPDGGFSLSFSKPAGEVVENQSESWADQVESADADALRLGNESVESSFGLVDRGVESPVAMDVKRRDDKRGDAYDRILDSLDEVLGDRVAADKMYVDLLQRVREKQLSVGRSAGEEKAGAEKEKEIAVFDDDKRVKTVTFADEQSLALKADSDVSRDQSEDVSDGVNSGVGVSTPAIGFYKEAVVPPLAPKAMRENGGKDVVSRMKRNDVRSDNRVGGYYNALEGVAGVGYDMRVWMKKTCGMTSPRRSNAPVMTTVAADGLLLNGQNARAMLAVIGDKALAAGIALKAMTRGLSVAEVTSMQNSVLSNANLGRVFVAQQFDKWLPKSRNDYSVGRSGGTAMEVIFGVLAVDCGLRAVETAMSMFFVGEVDTLADVFKDSEIMSSVDEDCEFAASIKYVNMDSYKLEKRTKVSAVRMVIAEISGAKCPGRYPELDLWVRYGDVGGSADKESLRVMAQFGIAVRLLLIAMDCFTQGLPAVKFSERQQSLTVETTAEQSRRSDFRKLFLSVDGGAWKSKVGEAHSVYTFIGMLARRMKLESVLKVARFYDLL